MADIVAFILLFIIASSIWRLRYKRITRHEKERIHKTRWSADYETVKGETHVMVRRVYTDRKGDLQTVESDKTYVLLNNDPGWEVKFHEAMSEAQARAIALNSELPIR